MGRDGCDDPAVREGVGARPWIVDDDLWMLVEPLLPLEPAANESASSALCRSRRPLRRSQDTGHLCAVGLRQRLLHIVCCQ